MFKMASSASVFPMPMICSSVAITSLIAREPISHRQQPPPHVSSTQSLSLPFCCRGLRHSPGESLSPLSRRIRSHRTFDLNAMAVSVLDHNLSTDQLVHRSRKLGIQNSSATLATHFLSPFPSVGSSPVKIDPLSSGP